MLRKEGMMAHDTHTELKKAEKQYEQALEQQHRAMQIAAELLKDREQNHYADMVRRALWQKRK
jgi:hypothetical protein